MRMASILEGIYHYHDVKFQFVRVLVSLLEEEGLIKDAYVEEFKRYVNKFVKGLEVSVDLAPMIKQYLTDQRTTNKLKAIQIFPIVLYRVIIIDILLSFA